MLLWINGPFGGGKTQTAYELQRRMPGSFVCDPERIGFGLHRAQPPPLRADFQDLASWRHGVYEVLDSALASYPGTLIVPMTIIESTYFDEIIGRLRDGGHDIRHFALLAARETVVRRLRERRVGDAARTLVGRAAAPQHESFALAKLDLCLTRLREPTFAEHIWTDHISTAQVAEHIAAAPGLHLEPNTDSALRGRIRRAWIGMRHIRWG